MIHPSTIQLLRFPFSFFLLPVYLFALGHVPDIHISRALVIFIILHLLVYPSSNGYNSYMDKDEGSIGAIKKPMQPTKQLLWVTICMDMLAVFISIFISWQFAVGIMGYILASRMYSYRNIRLKKYPIAGYLTVIIFQGAVTFFLVYHGSSFNKNLDVPPEGMIASSLLIGGFYPLTQVYQHDADRKDGIITISSWLGYRGTFVFTAVIYSLAMLILWYDFHLQNKEKYFYILATAMIPVLVYFFMWAGKVWRDITYADFRHTMKMNMIASFCTNIAFLIIIMLKI